MKIKTIKLIGPALAWAVAVALGDKSMSVCLSKNSKPGVWVVSFTPERGTFELKYGEDCALSDQVIDQEGIATRKHMKSGKWFAMMSSDLGDSEGARWSHYTWNVPKGASTSRLCRFDGPTRLVAAMRCFVGFRFGDTVDVPDALVTEDML